MHQVPLATLLKWLGLSGLWVISVALAAAFLASGTIIGPLTLIALIADIFGIIMGTLGIYYYFRADELNKQVAKETQQTTLNIQSLDSRVEELNTRMWEAVSQALTRESSYSKDAMQALNKATRKLNERASLPEPAKKEIKDELTIVQRFLDSDETLRQESVRRLFPSESGSLKQRQIDELAKIAIQVNLGTRPEEDLVQKLNSLIEHGLRLKELPIIYNKLGFIAVFNENATIKKVVFNTTNTK